VVVARARGFVSSYLVAKQTMAHETWPQMNATTNATMSADEHHHDPRNVSMLPETQPQMLHDC
jgi:hypothetical protein